MRTAGAGQEGGTAAALQDGDGGGATGEGGDNWGWPMAARRGGHFLDCREGGRGV